MFDLSKLRVNPRNPYPERETDFALLKDKINEHPNFLELRPIVYDDKDVEDGKFLILGGNKRFKALQALNHKKVPNDWVKAASKLTEEEKHEFVLADNVGFGSWDADIVLEDWGKDVADEWGIDLPELEEEEIEPAEDDFNQPLPTHAKTVLGDLYELHSLGKGLVHRVQCEDSTDSDSVESVLRGNEIDLLITDPPYGVAYVGKTEEELEIANDSLSADGTHELWRSALLALWPSLKPGGAIYATVPPGPLFIGFASVLHELESLRQVLNWAKSAFVMGRSDYHYQHEPILYGWKPGAAHYFVDDRTKSSLIEAPRPNANREHPTMKPIELWAELVMNSSRLNEVCFDPFLGSGTTLITCEQLDRNCAGLELTEKYTDVIVKRWAKYMTDNDLEFKILRNGEDITEEGWILETTTE